MTLSSDELMVQRQLRAAEIALETARRRRFETDEAMRELQLQAEQARAAAAAAEAARERDAAEAREQLAAFRAMERVAEQRYMEERHRRLALEQELSALAADRRRRDDLARQLAAERRVEELLGELELVQRRAAEFEYGVRMAAFDAFKLLREMSDRVGAALTALGLARGQAPTAPPGPAPMPDATATGETSASAMARSDLGFAPADAVDDRLDAADDEHAPSAGGDPRPETADAPRVADVLDSQRLDAALARLRADLPTRADDD